MFSLVHSIFSDEWWDEHHEEREEEPECFDGREKENAWRTESRNEVFIAAWFVNSKTLEEIRNIYLQVTCRKRANLQEKSQYTYSLIVGLKRRLTENLLKIPRIL